MDVMNLDELQAVIDQPGPRAGQAWRHHKGGIYTILARAIDEATKAPLVIYQSSDTGLIWSRTLADFMGFAMPEIPRFRRVAE